ncbi:I78 family peptidase inhibitor [Thioclava sp. FR2]|uniref:I78 family peptidase inhibitor n=1 Tax=Thioclava sp. FR2 TaxID=3445780 RepID=UPI003EBE7695
MSSRSSAGGFALAFLIALAACTPSEVPLPSPVPPGADACGASELQYLLGQKAAVLAALSLPVGTRIIPPGTAVTMDYRPDRLNIELDDNDRITRVHCT